MSTPIEWREELDSAERDAAREDAAWDVRWQLDDEETAAWEKRHGRGWPR